MECDSKSCTPFLLIPMAQIMREVAEDARESTRRAAERVASGIETATQAAQARVEETLNRLRNGSK